MREFLQFVLRSLLLLIFISGVVPGHSQLSTPADLRHPVLVELFTSEGCSDCPPADALLAELDRKQPVPGAQVIVLSEHVTYWNHLGWRDPFSSEVMDRRQESYDRAFGLRSVYTPQAIVDGHAEVVGNNSGMLQHAILLAAQGAKSALAIADAHRNSDGSVAFKVQGNNTGKLNLTAVLASDVTRSEVTRGENAGRVLHHVAVARALQTFGSDAAEGRQLTLTSAGIPVKEKDDGPLRLVVFLSEQSSGKVVAAAQATLN